MRGKLRDCWAVARRLPTEQQFLEGEPVNYGGLLFVLDPADATLVHIAVPLDEFDRSEIPDMVREAREIFIDFVRERTTFEKLAGRSALLVRVVASYACFDEEVCDRVRIDHWRNDDWKEA